MFDPVAFGALVKSKRGAKRLSQENLAADVFGDPGRKGDISRIENARVTPQEATIQKLCTALGISEAEMAPIRQGRPAAEQLANIPALSREDLQNLASRFGLDKPFVTPDAELRRQLTQKADEHRKLVDDIAALKGLSARIDNIRAAAEQAAEDLRFDEAIELLETARETIKDQLREPLVANAALMERQAEIALLRNRVEQAYQLYCDAADSFRAIDPTEAADRRWEYQSQLYFYALKYGSRALDYICKILEPAIASIDAGSEPERWAKYHNNLGNAYKLRGDYAAGKDATKHLAAAISAYGEASLYWTKDEHPEMWASVKINIGNTLQSQGLRTDQQRALQKLEQAAKAYEEALDVYTPDRHPSEWATCQNNYGNALTEIGARTSGSGSRQSIAKAVGAFFNALRVRKRENNPIAWATTQNNLGNSLRQQGVNSPQGVCRTCMLEAVTAYQAALQVRTKQNLIVDWATTESNMSRALSIIGYSILGMEGRTIIQEALTRLEAVVLETPKANHPVHWADRNEHLAITHLFLADHDTTADPRPHLETALAHVEAALTVYDPAHMSYHHEKAALLRDDIRARLAAPDGAAG